MFSRSKKLLHAKGLAKRRAGSILRSKSTTRQERFARGKGHDPPIEALPPQSCAFGRRFALECSGFARKRMDGAPRRIRTADPFITNEVLYQLSYWGIEGLLPPSRGLFKASNRAVKDHCDEGTRLNLTICFSYHFRPPAQWFGLIFQTSAAVPALFVFGGGRATVEGQICALPCN